MNMCVRFLPIKSENNKWIKFARFVEKNIEVSSSKEARIRKEVKQQLKCLCGPYIFNTLKSVYQCKRTKQKNTKK